MSSPPEGPEHRTDTLSPISPKPVHFPAPSNIALLETQMDPNFDGGELGQERRPVTQTNGRKSRSPQAPANGQAAKMNSNLTQVSDTAGEPHNSTFSTINETNGAEANTQIQQSSPKVEVPYNAQNGLATGQHNATPKAESLPSLIAQSSSTAPSTVNAPAPPPGQPLSELGQITALRPEIASTSGAPVLSIPPGVDIQAILDNISASSKASTAPAADPLTATSAQPADPGAAETLLQSSTKATPALNGASLPNVPSAANLPPRPPSYRSQNQSANPVLSASSNDAPTPASEDHSSSVNPSFAPLANAAPPPLPTAGAPGAFGNTPSSLISPPIPPGQVSPGSTATLPFVLPGQIGPISAYAQSQSLTNSPKQDRIGVEEHEDIRWGPDTQKKYDDFLVDERRYVQEGNWEKFPIGSRLFLGNLPSEKVTKRDLFHVFHRYGKLAQISIKQAYGFVQYLSAENCGFAMQREQGVQIRGKAIHLEISVPGGKKRNQQSEGRQSRNRRSRSPPGSRTSNRRSDTRHRNRSPTRPRIDHYDGRTPRSPQIAHGHDARPWGHDDTKLPLPYRQPGQVPEVQIIAKDALEKQFVQYIQGSFQNRNLRSDVIFLNPSLDEGLVMRRQVVEGVLAVMKVDRLSQAIQKFSLTVFDRSGGAQNVKFDEYQALEMHIVVELVLRAKQTARPPQATAQYNYHPQHQMSYPLPQQPAAPSSNFPLQPPSGPPPPSLPPGNTAQSPSASSIANMDSQALQDLLKRLSTQSQPNATAAPQMPSSAVSQLSQQPHGEQVSPSNLDQILKALQSSGAQQAGGQQARQQQSGTSGATPDISQIIGQLNRYGR